jgi:copper(I)-binding protein
MRMRELDGLPLPPHATVELKPGQGNHLMLMDLKSRWRPAIRLR